MRPIVLATLAFAIGSAVGLRFAAPAVLAGIACVLVIVLALLQVTGSPAAGRVPRRMLLVLLGGSGWSTGAAAAREVARDCRVTLRDGARVEALGVPEGVARAGGSTNIDLLVLRSGGRTLACTGLLRVRMPPRVEPPAPGVPVAISGRWWASPAASRWPAPPARAGTLAASRIVPVPDAHRRPLIAVRGRVQARVRALFGAQAGMVEAVLLARTEALDPEIRRAFAASGLSHLLAISGTHVALVAAAMLMLTRMARLPARAGALVGGGATTGYVLLLGAPHAAARAALQVLMVLGARIAQRPADPYALMAAAALILLCRHPTALLDAGFQLSFAGVFGLLAFQRPLRDAFPAIVPPKLADALSTTLAATVATTPIAALHFGLVSYVGLLANLVAVPITAIAVPAAALTLAADLVHPAAGQFIAGGAAVPFALLERTAYASAAVPHGHAYWGTGMVTTTLIAAAVFFVVRAIARGERGTVTSRRRAMVLAVAGGVLIPGLPLPGRAGELEIHVIDVGQGDAIAVRTPARRWLLIDTGPRSERFDAGSMRVAPYLRDRGVRRLDLMILTHPDLDHIGGAPAILHAIPVRFLLDPALPTAKESFYETLQAASATGTRWYAARGGRELSLDGVSVSLLAPLDRALYASGEANDLSVVFHLDWGPFGALFTGDAPRSVENALVALHDRGLASDLLKIGHHGSRTSTGDSLLAAARPRLAVVSVGARNRYGHPDPGVLARLARHGVRVLRTDRQGSIVVRVARDGTITYMSER